MATMTWRNDWARRRFERLRSALSGLGCTWISTTVVGPDNLMEWWGKSGQVLLVHVWDTGAWTVYGRVTDSNDTEQANRIQSHLREEPP